MKKKLEPSFVKDWDHSTLILFLLRLACSQLQKMGKCPHCRGWIKREALWTILSNSSVEEQGVFITLRDFCQDRHRGRKVFDEIISQMVQGGVLRALLIEDYIHPRFSGELSEDDLMLSVREFLSVRQAPVAQKISAVIRQHMVFVS